MTIVLAIVLLFNSILSGVVAEVLNKGCFVFGFFFGIFGVGIALAKHFNKIDKLLKEIISNQEQIAEHID